MLQIPIVFVNNSDFSPGPKFPGQKGFFGAADDKNPATCLMLVLK
jgi:hypothetical protein